MPVAKPKTENRPPAEPKVSRPPRRAYVHATATDGRAKPSQREMTEGAAWKQWAQNPHDERAANAWADATLLLQAEQPAPCVSRCACCGVRLYGRSSVEHGCGNCGHKGLSLESADWHKGESCR